MTKSITSKNVLLALLVMTVAMTGLSSTAFATITGVSALTSDTVGLAANNVNSLDADWTDASTDNVGVDGALVTHFVEVSDDSFTTIIESVDIGNGVGTHTFNSLNPATTYDVRVIAEFAIAGNQTAVTTTGTTNTDTEDPVVVGSTTNVVDGGNTELTNSDAYVEACTATDNDTNFVDNCSVQSGSIDTSVLGAQSVTYVATDASSNSGTDTVSTTLVDTTLPVIALTDVSPINIELNVDTYVEQGATVTDNDSATSGTATIGDDTVDESTIGVYTVTYDSVDASSNNAVQVTRTVNVVDTQIPVIALTGADPINIIKDVDTYTEQGAIVTDNNPATSASAVVGGNTVDESIIAVYTVTYDVADPSGNNAVQVTRTVNVIAGSTPTISLTGANPQFIVLGAGYSELGATASDTEDEDISGSIVINSSAFVDAVGLYDIDYDVQDSSGNDAPTVQRTVNVILGNAPVITLNGGNVNLSANQSYSEAGATCEDVEDGAIVVVISGSVNSQSDTVSTITYTCTDSSRNITIDTRTVTRAASGGGSSDNAHKTKPTYGLSHETQAQIVENGFKYGKMGLPLTSQMVTDNFHTDFETVVLTTGVMYEFHAKAYADKGLKIQEFLFGIPVTGQAHNAEVGVEVWYDHQMNIEQIKVVQDSNVVDVDSVLVEYVESKCQASDTTDRCDTTILKMKFLEPLQYDVMAIKGIDQKGRIIITHLNEGFNVDGEQFTPMLTKQIKSPTKYEGLIEVTQTEKYSDLWVAKDGRVFEMNSFESFKLVSSPEVDEKSDTGLIKNRMDNRYSDWQTLQAQEAKYNVFNSDDIQGTDKGFFAYETPEKDSRTKFLEDKGMIAFIRG